MFCQHCGKQIPDNTKFCQYCGAAVNNTSEQPATNRQFQVNTQPARQTVPPQKGKTGLLIAAAAVVVVGIGAGAFFLLSGKKAEEHYDPYNPYSSERAMAENQARQEEAFEKQKQRRENGEMSAKEEFFYDMGITPGSPLYEQYQDVPEEDFEKFKEELENAPKESKVPGFEWANYHIPYGGVSSQSKEYRKLSKAQGSWKGLYITDTEDSKDTDSRMLLDVEISGEAEKAVVTFKNIVHYDGENVEMQEASYPAEYMRMGDDLGLCVYKDESCWQYSPDDRWQADRFMEIYLLESSPYAEHPVGYGIGYSAGTSGYETHYIFLNR